ncbi:hypothetical protein [Nitrosomonas sp. Nm166]|uniref:hypothetical protein n=1 Tax=Nitrosomonas sp. Nm166 TaxID=1881054 RepID=UPI0008F3E4E1|nr:hypothetical protein [Nitrosomonas sp. Nm166]SFD95337.1 hypothetical protein SAMN05428977_100368 [Nitrosomonas sp. Nm166]
MILPIAIKGQYDVIQVSEKFFVFAEKLYQARNQLIPHHQLDELKVQIIQILLYKVILPRVDHIFVQSEWMKENVAQHGILLAKMTAAPMGIRTDQVEKPEDANTKAPISVFLILSPTKLIEYMAMAKCIVANELPEQCQVMVSGVGRCISWSKQAFSGEICFLLEILSVRE